MPLPIYNLPDYGEVGGAAPSTPPGAVTSVNGDTGDVIVSAASLGLGNVNNTSDATKPVSAAQAAAIAAAQTTITDGSGHTYAPVVPAGVGGAATITPVWQLVGGGGTPPAAVPASAPTISGSVTNATSVSLSCTLLSDASSYQWYKDGVAIGGASPSTTQTVTGLTSGVTYTFTVRGINSAGNGPLSAGFPLTPGSTTTSSGPVFGISADGYVLAHTLESVYPSLNVGMIGAYATRDNSGAFTGSNLADTSWATSDSVGLSGWKNGRANWTVDFAFPLGGANDRAFPSWIGTTAELDAIAAGSFDSEYNAMFAMLVSQGVGNCYLRPGWEMAQSTSSPASYVAAFQHVVDLARATSGASFKIVWCPNGQGPDASAWYPGDTYVDVVGLDAYDWQFNGESPHQAIFDGGVTNLNWLATFAAAHGKPTAFGEFSCVSTSVNGGLGDDPAYIALIANFLKTNNGVYACMYNNADGTGYLAGTPPNTVFDAVNANFGGIVPGAGTGGTPTAVTLPYYQGCGSTSSVTTGGITYGPDNYYVDAGGGVTTTTTAISGTTDDTLYQTQRWGMSAYNIPVTDGTKVKVTLKFAEINPSSGTRTFDISAEGVTEISSYSIASGASYTADDKTFTGITISGGVLNLGFTEHLNKPSIAAIVIAVDNLQPFPSLETGATLPEVSTGVTATFDTTHVLDGTQAVKLDTTNATVALDFDNTAAMQAPVVPGTEYSGSMWVWANAARTGVSCEIDWLDASHGYLSTSAPPGGAQTLTASGWVRLLCEGVTAPAGAAFASLKLVGTAFSSGDTLWVDELQVEPTATATPWAL